MMFAAMVIFCVQGDLGTCERYGDTRGPYAGAERCQERTAEMADDLFDLYGASLGLPDGPKVVIHEICAPVDGSAPDGEPA